MPHSVKMIKLRRMRWTGHVTCMRKRKSECRHLVGEPEGKKSLETFEHRWYDVIKIDIKDIGWDGMD